MDVKIKLKEIDEKSHAAFIGHLVEHPNVISLFSAAADYDFTCPIIARDYNHYQEIAFEIRKKFKHIVADWRVAVNLKVYKFEEYDVETLCNQNTPYD